MTLIQKIVVWLVTRFLNKDQLAEVFSDRYFTPGKERAELAYLYNRYAQRATSKNTPVSFNAVALDHLVMNFYGADLYALIYLMTIHRTFSGENKEAVLNFLKRIEEACAISNRMKRHAEIKAILRAELPVDETDLTILAHAAELKGSSEATANFIANTF